jgi:hypothetical protein
MNIPIWMDRGTYMCCGARVDVGDAVTWMLHANADAAPPLAEDSPRIRVLSNAITEVIGPCWVPSSVQHQQFFVIDAGSFHVGVMIASGVSSPGTTVAWRGRLWYWDHAEMEIPLMAGKVQAMYLHPTFIVKEQTFSRGPGKNPGRFRVIDFEEEGIPIASTEDSFAKKTDGAFSFVVEV